MSIAEIVTDIEAVLRVGTAVVQAGEDAAPYITQAYQLLTGATTLTDAQRQDLLARESALRAELQAPIPDEV